MVNGALLTDYVSPANAQLQTYPTVRMSGNYAGICLWGDNADVPTAIVLSAKSAKPIFTYTTPGSMFGVDLVHDVGASTPTNDVVYFAVAGKHTVSYDNGVTYVTDWLIMIMTNTNLFSLSLPLFYQFLVICLFNPLPLPICSPRE